MVLVTASLGIAVVLATLPQNVVPQRARLALIGVLATVAWLPRTRGLPAATPASAIFNRGFSRKLAG